jgi:hypothetical protein
VDLLEVQYNGSINLWYGVTKHEQKHNFKVVKLIRLYKETTACSYYEVYGGVKAQFHSLLTSALDGHEWSDSYPSHFTPGY